VTTGRSESRGAVGRTDPALLLAALCSPRTAPGPTRQYPASTAECAQSDHSRPYRGLSREAVRPGRLPRPPGRAELYQAQVLAGRRGLPAGTGLL
jgi:hypothetical protein